MTHIAIPIPNVSGKHDIKIEVTINNQTQSLHYKIELFYWDDCQNPRLTVFPKSSPTLIPIGGCIIPEHRLTGLYRLPLWKKEIRYKVDRCYAIEMDTSCERLN